MVEINYTSPDGQQFKIPLPEGADPSQVVAEFEASNNIAAPALGEAATSTPNTFLENITAGLSAGTGAVDNLDKVIEPTGVPVIEDIKRGAGLAARVLPSAALKIPAGVSDLGASLLNLIPAGISKGSEALGGDPVDFRFRTDATANVDELLNSVFPEPQGFGERIVAGVGDIALAGGAGAAALAPKAGGLLRTPGSASVARNLGDDIGETFANTPKTFAALEATGGGGAVAAGELAADADASPTQQLLSQLAGGLAGVVAPQVAVNLGRRGATSVANAADSILSGERRAGRALQEAAADPEAAARLAADAPEGILPARATDDPGLKSLERRVLDDDPKLAKQAADDLEVAETRSLDELADSFGPTSDKVEFQQSAIERGAAPGTKIQSGQPDEMLDDAAESFVTAYKDAEGFPISTESVQAAGGNVPLRESLKSATTDKRVIVGGKARKRIEGFLNDLLDDVSRRGEPVAGRADQPVTQVLSEDIIEMRQIIRQEIRDRSRGNPSTKAKAEAKLLTNANQALTEVLESQLPDTASQALRATDARYTDFVTVQDAVLRSGTKGLTPEALRASAKARAASPGQFARGNAGDLGRAAEQGRDLSKLLGKPDEVSRVVRNMTPEQLQTAKADLNAAVLKKSEISGRLSAKKLEAQLKANRETLKAGGFTDADFKRAERITRELKLVQAREAAAPSSLLNDDVNIVLNLFARIAGSKSGSRILNFFGGAGAGGSLILTKFGSETLQKSLKGLSVSQADRVMREAFTNKDLMAALLVKPTDSLKKQADAARAFNAFILKSTAEEPESEGE